MLAVGPLVLYEDCCFRIAGLIEILKQCWGRAFPPFWMAVYGSNDIVSQSLLFSHNWEQLNVSLYGTLARSLVGGWKYKPGEKQRSKIRKFQQVRCLRTLFLMILHLLVQICYIHMSYISYMCIFKWHREFPSFQTASAAQPIRLHDDLGPRRPGHACDIGGNLGFYTFALAKAGWNVTTFEAMSTNVTKHKGGLGSLHQFH